MKNKIYCYAKKNILNKETKWNVPLFLKTKNKEKILLMNDYNLKINLNNIDINYNDSENKKNLLLLMIF